MSYTSQTRVVERRTSADSLLCAAFVTRKEGKKGSKEGISWHFSSYYSRSLSWIWQPNAGALTALTAFTALNGCADNCGMVFISGNELSSTVVWRERDIPASLHTTVECFLLYWFTMVSDLRRWLERTQNEQALSASFQAIAMFPTTQPIR